MRTSCATLLAFLLTCGLAALFVSGVGAAPESPLTGEWHRLSVDRSHPAPEHELLRCVENKRCTNGHRFRYVVVPVLEGARTNAWPNVEQQLRFSLGTRHHGQLDLPGLVPRRNLRECRRGRGRNDGVRRPECSSSAVFSARRSGRRADTGWRAALQLLGEPVRLPMVQNVL